MSSDLEAPPVRSYFVVKRKRTDNDDLIRDDTGKRVRTVGIFNARKNAEDQLRQFASLGTAKKRVYVKDFDDFDGFKKFLDEQQTIKKIKNEKEVKNDESEVDDNKNPFAGMNLSIHDFKVVHSNPPTQITCNGITMKSEKLEQSTDKSDAESQDASEEYVYQLFMYDPFWDATIHDSCQDGEHIYDYESDENDENWRGNDYPDEDELSGDSENDQDSEREDADYPRGYTRSGHHDEFHDDFFEDFDSTMRKLKISDSDDDGEECSDFENYDYCD